MLAHLARLDRLAGDAATDAFAGDFPAALARFEEGSDTPEAATPGEGADTAVPEPETPSPGQWSRRSTPPHPSCRKCGGRCLDADDLEALYDCPNFPERLEAMEIARPAGASEPDQLSEDGDPAGEVQAEQLAAFEAGVERWWLVMPHEYDEHTSDTREGWCYFEPVAGGR